MKKFNDARLQEIKEEVEEKINVFSTFSLRSLYNEAKAMKHPYLDPIESDAFVKIMFILLSCAVFFGAIGIPYLIIHPIPSESQPTIRDWVLLSLAEVSITLMSYYYWRNLYRISVFKKWVKKDLEILIQKLQKKNPRAKRSSHRRNTRKKLWYFSRSRTSL